MKKALGLRWAVVAAGAAMLLVLAAACGETVVKEVPVERIVEKEVVKEVPVEVEKVVEVEKEVVKEVVKEVPVEVVKEVEVIKEVPKVITEEKVVVREVEKIVIATPVPPGEELFYMKTLSPFPKRGGQLSLGAHGPPSHFDLWAAVSISNHGSQSGMFDGLMRRDPRHPQVPIIPDLAYRWEISPDLKTYTFFIREGVKYHDGAELTSADVKASFDRIIFGCCKDDLLTPRKSVFPTFEEVVATDDYTVEFKLSQPGAPGSILPALSMEWNYIGQKKIFEEYDYNLLKVDNYPGTGPYIYKSRDDDQWVQEANPNYWNPNAPYVDSVRHVWAVARSPEMSAAILGGITDWAQFIADKDGRDIGDRPGMNGARQHLQIIHGIGLNHNRAPLDDVRVRRAFMLVLDQQALLEALKDTKGLGFGEMFIGGTPYALPTATLAQMKGYRHPTDEDIAEAQGLLADAGFPNGDGFPTLDVLTRAIATQRITTPLIQGMLKQHLNVNTDIRIVDASAWTDQSFAGNFDIQPEVSIFALVADPVLYLRGFLGLCDGEPCPSNQVRFKSVDFNDLLDQMAAETDEMKRIAIADKIREFVNREVPYIPVDSSETVYHGWWDHLKGTMPPDSDFVANYELHKWDNAWLDR